MTEIDSSELRGRRVIDSKGANVGEVSDVAIEPNSWTVRGLIVEVDRQVADDINVKKPVLAGRPRMEIGTERIEAVGENVILNIDTDQIAGLLRRSDE